MRREMVFLSVAALVLSAATAMAQPDNFSGHWAVQVLGGAPRGTDLGSAPPPIPGAGRGPGGPTSVFGNDFTVTMDAKTLKVWHVDPAALNDTIRVSYNLDGSESKNPGSGFIGTPAELISTAKWTKKELAITTAGTPAPTVTTMRMNGKELWINTDRPGGPNGAITSTLTIYIKKK